jgi:hypothetical protein
MGKVRLDEDEIDTPGAEPAGVTDFGAWQSRAAKIRACQLSRLATISAHQDIHRVDAG